MADLRFTCDACLSDGVPGLAVEGTSMSRDGLVSSLPVDDAVVLAAVLDATRLCAVPFGHP
jgi:hypothetical protein